MPHDADADEVDHGAMSSGGSDNAHSVAASADALLGSPTGTPSTQAADPATNPKAAAAAALDRLRGLSSTEYLSLNLVRGLNATLLMAPWLFAAFALDDMLYVAMRCNPKSYREIVGSGLRVGAVQTLRASTWLVSATLLAAGAEEVCKVGFRHVSEPTTAELALATAANASAGALAAGLASVRVSPEKAIGARFGRVLPVRTLRMGYVCGGAVLGTMLPAILMMLSPKSRRLKRQMEGSSGGGPPHV